MSAASSQPEIATINGRAVVRRRKKGLVARFWTKVDRRGPDECWLWTGGLKSNGYGQISGDPGPDEYVGRKLSAHRLAYELTHGAIPDGLHVLHRCDNRACVNPAHLFLGTHQDNMADMMGKARHAHGERQPTRKLDRHRVRSIRWLAEHDPGPKRDLATEFGVTAGAITNILKGKSWRLD